MSRSPSLSSPGDTNQGETGEQMLAECEECGSSLMRQAVDPKNLSSTSEV